VQLPLYGLAGRLLAATLAARAGRAACIVTDKPWLQHVEFTEPPRMTDSRAQHSFPVSAREEHCHKCLFPAAHKIKETSGPGTFHPLTSYLCCSHFIEVMGPAHGGYPYELYAEETK
jgi:hypothetical protein